MTTQARLGRPPLTLVLMGGAAAALLVVPLLALVITTSWSRVPEVLGSAEVREALGLSLLTSLATVVVCVVFGTPLAWLLARIEFPGRAVLRALVTVPLVLPPVVAGVALTSALGRTGLVGEPLFDLLGLRIPFTTGAVIIAHSFVAMPFYVLAVEGSLRSVTDRLEVVAATLGATRWHTLRRVTIPLALPGVAAGAVLAWARSLGEFGATITFAGNFPGTTQTLPSLIFVRLQDDPAVAQATSLVLLVVSIVVILALRRRWWGDAR